MTLPIKALKKSLIAVILSGALAISGYFVALNGVFDLYQNIADNFFQKKAEDNLRVIYTGVSIKYIESIFGAPVKEEHSEDGKVNEYIYSFRKFYLQVVYDNKSRKASLFLNDQWLGMRRQATRHHADGQRF